MAVIGEVVNFSSKLNTLEKELVAQNENAIENDITACHLTEKSDD